MKKILALLVLLPALALASSTFNIFNPGPSGPVKSNGTYKLVAETSSDIIGLFTSCSGTQYLGADGACHTASGGGSSAITCTTACNASGLAVGQQLWIFKGSATNYTTQVGTGDGDLKVLNIPIGDYIVTAYLNASGPASGTLQGNLLDTGQTNGTSQCLGFVPTATGVQTGINTGTYPYQSVAATGGTTTVALWTCALTQTSISNMQWFFFNSLASQTSTVQASSWIRIERVL